MAQSDGPIEAGPHLGAISAMEYARLFFSPIDDFPAGETFKPQGARRDDGAKRS